MRSYDPFLLRKTGLAICLTALFCSSAGAQCTNNMATRSYDTLLTGAGYGNYRLSMPQWSPDSGLLVSVKLSTTVSVQYGFTMKDVDLVSDNYSLTVGREEFISGAVLPASYDGITELKIGVFSLNPGDVVTRAPFPFLTNYVSTDSLTSNLVPFMGSGTLHFTYSPSTYTTLHAGASYSFHAAVTDVMKVSLSYLYCRGGAVLATGLTSWEATQKDDHRVQLDWAVAKETGERRYVVQRSRDMRSFVEVGMVAADTTKSGDNGAGSGGGSAESGELRAAYTYMDTLPPGGGDRWYYRLLIMDPAGISYSPVKSVIIFSNNQSGSGLTVYPNPATDHIDLAMGAEQGGGTFAGAAGSSGWQVEVLSADGRLVQNYGPFYGNKFRVDFRRKLSPGVYFVRVTGLAGHKSLTGSFLVSSR